MNKFEFLKEFAAAPDEFLMLSRMDCHAATTFWLDDDEEFDAEHFY